MVAATQRRCGWQLNACLAACCGRDTRARPATRLRAPAAHQAYAAPPVRTLHTPPLPHREHSGRRVVADALLQPPVVRVGQRGAACCKAERLRVHCCMLLVLCQQQQQPDDSEDCLAGGACTRRGHGGAAGRRVGMSVAWSDTAPFARPRRGSMVVLRLSSRQHAALHARLLPASGSSTLATALCGAAAATKSGCGQSW